MSKLSKSWITLAVIISLVGVSSVALAGHLDDQKEDTEFSFAYDVDDHFLAINIGDNDTSWVCNFGTEELTGTYGLPDADEVILIETLKDGDGKDYEFEARTADKLGHDYPQETGTKPYESDGPCIVNGIVVAGPNGQVNHGQALKAAKSLLDMRGHGCVVRYLAQSNIGKDEGQVKTSEVDGWEFDAGDDGAKLTFEYHQADCYHGKKDRGDDVQTQGADRPRGKSGQAPGKLKDK